MRRIRVGPESQRSRRRLTNLDNHVALGGGHGRRAWEVGMGGSFASAVLFEARRVEVVDGKISNLVVQA